MRFRVCSALSVGTMQKQIWRSGSFLYPDKSRPLVDASHTVRAAVPHFLYRDNSHVRSVQHTRLKKVESTILFHAACLRKTRLRRETQLLEVQRRTCSLTHYSISLQG
jgi:hypothetical protein